MASAESTRAIPDRGSAREIGTRRLGDATAIVAFGLPAGAVLLYALQGGSYDLVIRQELGVAVWWILLLGLVTGVLPRAKPHRLAAVPMIGIVALVAVTALGLTYTESDERTVNELARVLHYGGILALSFALVDARTWRPAAAGLATGAVLVSVLALGSRLFPSLYPTDAVNRVFLTTRLQYPLSYWNGVAAFTAMTATLTLGFSAHVRSRAVRALALAPVPAVIGTTYLTYARGGVVAVGVGLIALVILAPYRAVIAVHAAVAAAASAAVILVIRSYPDIAQGHGTHGAGVVLLVVMAGALACAVAAGVTGATDAGPRLRIPSRPARVLAVGTGVAILALGVVFGPGLADRAWDDLRGPIPSTRSADPAARLSSLGSARAGVWEAALDTYRAEPRHGTGPGTFEFAWNRSPRYTEFVRDAHSFYLEALAEEGWPGLAAGLLLLGGLLLAGVALRVRARRDPIQAGMLAALLAAFAVYLAYAGYDWMWELTAVSLFGLVAVAIAIGSAGSVRSGPLDWRVRAGLALIALLAGLTQVPGLVSTAKVRSSQEAVRAGHLQAAMADAEDAIASAPWAATPYVQRALLFERTDRLRDAERDIVRARELEPTNYRHPLLLSRIDALQGKVPQALKAFRDARALAPKKTIVEGGPASIALPSGP